MLGSSLQAHAVLGGVGFGMLLLSSPLAIVLYFVAPTVLTVLAEAVQRLRAPLRWLDVNVTLPELYAPQLSGRAWARGDLVFVEDLGELTDCVRRPAAQALHSPRSRPMISFMISLDPAQIFVTRASRQARATRYSFM